MKFLIFSYFFKSLAKTEILSANDCIDVANFSILLPKFDPIGSVICMEFGVLFIVLSSWHFCLPLLLVHGTFSDGDCTDLEIQ